MKIKDFLIGWRTLVQEPAYSLVVVLGLGVGFAAALLLLGFVRYSWQYNAQIPDVDHVYVIKQRFNVDPKAPWFDQAPLNLRAAAEKIPGVLATTGYLPSRPQDKGIAARIDGHLHQVNSLTVLPSFAAMVGVKALHGDLKAALDHPDSIVISAAAAMRLFGKINAVERTMHVEGKLLRVAAVVPTPPSNTTIPFEALIGVNSVLAPELREEMITGKDGWWAKLLIRVHPDASLSAITATLQHAIDTFPAMQNQSPEVKAQLGKRKPMDIALLPLREAYFDRQLAETYVTGPGERANPVIVAGLGIIAVLILALAAINYVNLAAMRVLRRQREVAMRKVLGAGVRDIVLQMLAESMLVALLATGLGLLLASAALPLFGELVNRRLDSMLSPANIGAAIALGVLLGAVTAAYPAWIALRVRPNQVLAGRPDAQSAGGMRMRRILTVLQLSTAMGLASIALAVTWQTGYAMHASPGFDPAPLLIVDLPEQVKDSARAKRFIAALAAQPGVAGAAVSEDAVGRRIFHWFRDLTRPGGQKATMDMKSVSANFFELYAIKPVAGRLFDPKLDKEDDPVPVIINPIAARELGFATPEAALGQTLLFTGFDNKTVHKRIVGIAPDLRFLSLREAPRATAYELWTAGTTLSVRASGDLRDLETAVQALWPKFFPDALLRTYRAKDILAVNYADDARIARLLAIATALALAIAAFGIYVLSASSVQRRAKEIVLRKLHGAGRSDIGLLVLRETGALILVSAAVGLPLAAVAIARYLATYVEHAPIGYWTLLAALAATLAVALAAVARQAWIAMRMMPADALRA
jgi:putative ABC transport system permease protein